MESFDMFLNGNFVALPAFQRKYGVLVNGNPTIPTKWQSALFQSGQCGAFVGVFLAGPVTNRLGYRWTTILALILMNATIFISFFVSRENLKPQEDHRSPDQVLLPRPIHSPYLSSAKRWRVSHGVSSLPTPPPMPARSSLSLFEVRARRLCK